MKQLLITMTLILAAASAGGLRAQEVGLDFCAGMSQALDDQGNRGPRGVNMSLDWLMYPQDRVGVGVRVAINRWRPVPGRFSDDLQAIFDGGLGSDDAIIEIVPSMRIRSSSPGMLNFFAQVGVGAFILSMKPKPADDLAAPHVEQPRQWISTWGFSIGPGVSLGNWKIFNVQILPLYNVVFLTDRPLRYASINAGLMFGI